MLNKEEYSSHGSYQPIAELRLGPSKKFPRGLNGQYYLLRHKESEDVMNFFIVGKESYKKFSVSKWFEALLERLIWPAGDVDPWNRVVRTIYLRGSYNGSECEIAVGKLDGDLDDYLSIQS